MFVVIAGGGRTGATLANVLLGQDHEVRVVEYRPDVLQHLHRELPTESIHQGNPVKPEVLEAAGIAHANVFAACLHDDADNLAACFLARVRFNVGRTIACINNPRNSWMFGPAFHVDVALNQAQILASLILEEMSLGDMMTLLKLRRGRFSLVEEKIPAGAVAVGKCLKDLALPPQSVIAAVIRRGEILIPRGALEFESGDEVLAICDPSGAEDLAAMFGGVTAHR